MDFLYDFKQAQRDRFEDAGVNYGIQQITNTVDDTAQTRKRKPAARRLVTSVMTLLAR